ncbi:MAG: hypothetical protein ACOYOQ_00510 [Microthrixaceae bacterium]
MTAVFAANGANYTATVAFDTDTRTFRGRVATYGAERYGGTPEWTLTGADYREVQTATVEALRFYEEETR